MAISLFADIEEITLDNARLVDHYNNRRQTSQQLQTLLSTGRQHEYLELALGLSDVTGNFSASDHNLGNPIRHNNSEQVLFEFAQQLANEELTTAQMIRLIYGSGLSHLKIGVGSEMACMLQPNKFWVGNIRTIWCYLFVRHSCDRESVNVELQAYRDHDDTSEMAYKLWRDIYPRMRNNLLQLEAWVNEQSSIVPEPQPNYLWIDAICNELFHVAAD